MDRHRRQWREKPGLRQYYHKHIFAPLLDALGGRSPVLELGSGPGFFRTFLAEHGCHAVAVDIDPDAEGIRCDVHHLPFADQSFAGIVGVDCLHHFAQPGAALREIARVLRPGGRLLLCEPWTGALGRLFYRHLHHEDCFRPEDPVGAAFPADKAPMDGNAQLPKLVLHDDPAALARTCPGLTRIETRPFACLAYLLTGGFQGWGLPAPLVMAVAACEDRVPEALMRHMALRAIFVFEGC